MLRKEAKRLDTDTSEVHCTAVTRKQKQQICEGNCLQQTSVYDSLRQEKQMLKKNSQYALL